MDKIKQADKIYSSLEKESKEDIVIYEDEDEKGRITYTVYINDDYKGRFLPDSYKLEELAGSNWEQYIKEGLSDKKSLKKQASVTDGFNVKNVKPFKRWKPAKYDIVKVSPIDSEIKAKKVLEYLCDMTDIFDASYYDDTLDFKVRSIPNAAGDEEVENFVSAALEDALPPNELPKNIRYFSKEASEDITMEQIENTPEIRELTLYGKKSPRKSRRKKKAEKAKDISKNPSLSSTNSYIIEVNDKPLFEYYIEEKGVKNVLIKIKQTNPDAKITVLQKMKVD